MRRLAPILALLATAALAAVALAQEDSAPAARATAIAASGSFAVINWHDGRPIFVATNLAPGGSADGTVTIEDSGSEATALVLRRGELVDTPGLGGGVLSARLQLSVVDVTAPGAPRTVYTGPASMPEQTVGELEPGEVRTFEFTATLPEGGEPNFQNAVQGASTTVAYTWVAEAAGGGGGEEGEDGGGSAGGGGPPVGQPGTSPTPVGAGGAAGQIAVLDLTVPRVRRALRGGRLVVWTHCDESCRLTVRGRIRATVAGHHRGARITLTQKRLAGAGPQRLRIPLPPKLRRWLRHQTAPKRLRAMLRFTAIGTDGQRDAVRKTVRLRAGGR